METDARRLDRWSWIFIAAGTLRALVVPAVAAVFASGGVLLWRPELLSLVVIVPAGVYGYVRQRFYSYRFTDDELVVRDGVLFRNVRRIPYERVHNVALVQNPLHRALGVATARIETATGGRPEALMRVLSLEAAEELRRYTLGEARGDEAAAEPASYIDGAATGEGAAPAEGSATADGGAPGGSAAYAEGAAPAGSAAYVDGQASVEGMPADRARTAAATTLVDTPDSELVRLGLISNRGFLVVAAVVGVLSQVDWWEGWLSELDWTGVYDSAQQQGPGWLRWLLDSGSIGAKVLFGLAAVLLFLVMLRLLSVAWYLTRYRGFSLRRSRADLRTEYGLLTRVSSVIPVYRIQLLTVTASLLHRWFDRASIEIETAGASQDGSDVSQQLAISGLKFTRQWLAPLVPGGRSGPLIRQIMPEIDLESVDWRPIEARAVRRIVKRVALVVVPIGVMVTVVLTFTPVRLLGLNALWIPGVVLPLAWLLARRWVHSAGWALTDDAIFFRSGWPGRHTTVVRFANMQTVALKQSPFDRRNRMATVRVDTAGAGMGHRIEIPFLDAGLAAETLKRLYAETCATEFRW